MDAHVDAFVERVADRLACTRCLGDPALRREAVHAGFDDACDYCGRRGTCVDVAWLADRVHALVQGAFARASGDDAYVVGSYDLIGAAARFDAPLAADVHAQLAALHRDDDGTRLYGAGCAYAVPHPGVDVDDWDGYAASVASLEDGRALDALKWAFDGFETRRTRKGRAAVRVLPPRTRVFVAAPALPSTARRALDACGVHAIDAPASAGHVGGPRVRAAFDAAASIGALRPVTGASVVVRRTRLARELRVLDVDALRKSLAGASAFDAEGWVAQRRAAFVRGFRDALRGTDDASPPQDGIAREPWPDAVRIALDWLAHGPSPRLDGVITRSGGGGGRTLVLFAGAVPALVPDRVRLYEVDGTRDGYRRLDGSAEVAGRFADADREQGDDADAGHDDDFHGSPP